MLMGNRRNGKQKRGSALVLVMMFVLIFSLVIAAIMTDVQHQTRQTHRARIMMNSLEGARAALNSVANNVVYMCRTRPPQQLGGVITNLNEIVHEIEPIKPEGMKMVHSSATNKMLTYIRDRGPNDFEYRENVDPNEPWYGYSTAKLDWEIVSYVVEDVETAKTLGFKGMGLRQRVTIDYIPFYQFAIFYAEEMDLHPGPTMNVRGRVHSNGDMYLTTSSGLNFHEKVTAAGNIYRMMKNENGSHASGPVQFLTPLANGQTVWRNMKNPPSPNNGDNYLDHRDDEVWYQASLDRWRERVLDSAHGISPINPPLPSGLEMYDLLRRADESDTQEMKNVKMEYLADIVITGDPGNPSTINGYYQEVDTDGVRTLTEIDSAELNNIVELGLFYDGHQQTIVRTLDIRLDQLDTLSGINWAPANGVVYVSTTPNAATDNWTLSPLNQDPIPVLDDDGTPTFNNTTLAPIVTFEGWMNGGNGSLEQAKDRYMPAVRVIDGTHVPRNNYGGFALYTDRPLYVAGDINTNDKATAVLGGESITVTSTPLWLAELDLGKNDSSDSSNDGIPDTSADRTKTILKNDNPDKPATAVRKAGFSREMGDNWRASRYRWDRGKWYTRSADNITQNIIYLMGNTPTVHDEGHQSGDTDAVLFSGGAHNVMRYLEDWTKIHTLNGSMIILFGGPVAMHKFRCCNHKGYYTPPRRNYNWDSSLKSSEPPPGMPVFIEVNVSDVEVVSYDYADSNAP